LNFITHNLVILSVICFSILSSAQSFVLCGELFGFHSSKRTIDSPLFSSPRQNRFDYNLKRGPHDYHASAELEIGNKIHFSLYLKNTEGRSEISGRDFIRKVVLDVFPEANFIKGLWTGGSYMPDNYVSFYKAINEGLTFKEAAFSTHTGKVAHSLGFTEVYRVKEYRDKDPVLSKVLVVFYRKELQPEMDIIDQVKEKVNNEIGSITIELKENMHPNFFKEMDWFNEQGYANKTQVFHWTFLGTEINKAMEGKGYGHSRLSLRIDSHTNMRSIVMKFHRR